MLKKYHRPESVEDVLDLLNRSGVRTAILAGGTSLVAELPGDVDEVVDLQAVGLNTVSHTSDRMTLGAMVQLRTIVEDRDTPQLLRRMAHREGPNTFRNIATIGGVVAGADPGSELLAALLVMDAWVDIQTLAGIKRISLSDSLADISGALQGGVITTISLHKSNHTTHARVARTPRDKPIVAAIAARTDSGPVRLALCGVAETVILVDPDNIDAVNPPGDFRGSSAYRKQMAVALSQRVLRELETMD